MTYQDLYNENQILDDLFYDKYHEKVKDFHIKNMLELLVELGELANDSKCFKYWSLKSMDKESALEEFADCLLMVLYIYKYLNIDEININKFELSDNITLEFINIYNKTLLLVNETNIENAKVVLNNLISLGYKLGFTDEDIIRVGFKKIEINKMRLESDY